MALPGVADSLAGRIEVLTLWPLAGAELGGTPGQWLEGVFGALAADVAPPVVDQARARAAVGAALERRVLAGGYPEAVQRSPERRMAWVRNYVDRILQRDVREIATVDKAAAIPRLVQALAHVSGQPCNYTQLGGQLGLDAKTVHRYVTLLERLFLVRRVSPWSTNALSRVIKSPRVHLTDPGVLASLLRLSPERVARNRGTFGRVVECFVYGELLRLASWTVPVELLTYRDRDQVEVDFVLEHANGETLGIEVKAAAAVQHADTKGLRHLAAGAGPGFLGGIVLYDGTETLPLGRASGRPLWAMPLASLWLT
jgi:predicted AAA+ superfamily ATPase